MQRALVFVVIFIFLPGIAAIVRADEPSQDAGKAAFLSNKCNLCHSVESQKIEMQSGGYQKSTEKNVPPDLSGIGKKLNAEWFAKYLKHEEALDGLKHAKSWRGSNEEIQALSKWLEGLK